MVTFDLSPYPHCYINFCNPLYKFDQIPLQALLYSVKIYNKHGSLVQSRKSQNNRQCPPKNAKRKVRNPNFE